MIARWILLENVILMNLPLLTPGILLKSIASDIFFLFELSKYRFFFKQLTLNFDRIQSWWIMIKPLVTHFVHLPDNDDIPFSVFRLRIFGIGNIKVWSIWTLIRSYFYVVFLGAYIEDLVCSIWN